MMLAKLLRDHNPSEVVVAFDAVWPTFRHRLFPAYKQTRGALPNELLAQVALMQDLLSEVGVSVVSVPGFEGDDILASLAKRGVDERSRILLVSGDRDLVQLIRDPWVSLLYTRRGVAVDQVLDEGAVERMFGVPATRYADFAAIRGDASDNIEGVPGVGPKRAAELINKCESLDELWSATVQLSPRLRDTLASSRERVELNVRLMRLDASLPVDWDGLDLRLRLKKNAAPAFQRLGLSRAFEALIAASDYAELPNVRPEMTLSPLESLETNRPTKRMTLVACCSEKVDYPAPAKHLYQSPLFLKSKAWADSASELWYILSAKHGLLHPDKVVEPYDVTLADLSKDALQRWAAEVVRQIHAVSQEGDLMFVLAGRLYSQPIHDPLRESGRRVALPLDGMSIGRRLRFLNAELKAGPGAVELEQFYEIISRLGQLTGGQKRMTVASSYRWPQRGVYFYFEPGEHRLCSNRLRVVRVGTHAVSANSKATLWNRLRTHRGVEEGGGNHRSSIFRSHVGAALLRRDSREADYPAWGDQTAGTLEVRAAEREVEHTVTAQIAEMLAVAVEIRDEPGPRSDRAFIERNSIALLSSIGSQVDVPSETWLGRWSASSAVRRSGLWNINYVDEPTWDSSFLDVLDRYVRATAGQLSFPARSIAPHGWWERKAPTDQMTFGWSDDVDHLD